MSVSYEIRERFSTSSTSSNNLEAQGAKRIMQRQLALLLMKQLCVDDGSIDVRITGFRIELDGKKSAYHYGLSGILSVEIQEAIQGIANAGQIDIDIAYNYIWRYEDDHLSIGPFVMTEYLDECSDEVFDCLDYAMHNFADSVSDTTAGVLVVYGKRQGSNIRGIVEPTVSHNLPEHGEWRAPMTALIFDEIPIKDENSERAVELCKLLMQMSEYDDLSLDGNELSFAMNNAFLDTPSKIKDFVAYTTELASLLHLDSESFLGNFMMNACFVDISVHGPNIMNINIDLQGNLAISVALSGAGEVEWKK